MNVCVRVAVRTCGAFVCTRGGVSVHGYACTLSSPQASATSLEGLSVRWGRPRVRRRLIGVADRALVGAYRREFALAGICSGSFSVRQGWQPCQLTASDGASVSNGPSRAVL